MVGADESTELWRPVKGLFSHRTIIKFERGKTVGWVKVLAFYSDDPISNPTGVDSSYSV